MSDSVYESLAHWISSRVLSGITLRNGNLCKCYPYLPFFSVSPCHRNNSPSMLGPTMWEIKWNLKWLVGIEIHHGLAPSPNDLEGRRQKKYVLGNSLLSRASRPLIDAGSSGTHVGEAWREWNSNFVSNFQAHCMCSACSNCSKVTFTSQFSDSLNANQAHESQIELIKFPNRLIIRSWLLFWIFARRFLRHPPVSSVGDWKMMPCRNSWPKKLI